MPMQMGKAGFGGDGRRELAEVTFAVGLEESDEPDLVSLHFTG
jgi:hypothetical protein